MHANEIKIMSARYERYTGYKGSELKRGEWVCVEEGLGSVAFAL